MIDLWSLKIVQVRGRSKIPFPPEGSVTLSEILIFLHTTILPSIQICTHIPCDYSSQNIRM